MKDLATIMLEKNPPGPGLITEGHMASRFHADTGLPIERYREVAALDPTNPFYTPCYVDALCELGFQPWLLSTREKNRLTAACPAFLKSGRLSKSLEIPSLCPLPDADTFWEGILRFCKDRPISSLNINSYASQKVAIPPISREIDRKGRIEYVLSLAKVGLWEGLSSNHRRNIKRGLQIGLQMHCITTEEACTEHVRLQRASMRRRDERGESVPFDGHGRKSSALIKNGAGELYQVLHQGEVVSSVLVLKAEKGAYYQSAGTSPHGMRIGASHFLVYHIAEALQKESMELFNLGGTDESAYGLQRFKSGFGATEVRLESARFFLGSRVKQHLYESARTLRNLLDLRGIRT